ncbi:peptidase M23 [Chryseotalea sanaruensis]|uniref:Peptidase M23 n=1 Tax=Chryseotalea sanaruensis TaxID=2482724 RepID=A0A401UA23_9BACT|nr:peptidoglycan DD-metalloendopeptidase family protein [Chryseotalea sanaruensis]GCC51727.1 peptidase M23 [Chryseotalea sanaruensis]
MKKIKFFSAFSVLFFLSTFSFAQTEKPTYKSAADSFEKNYNADNYDAIFAGFSPEMQKALPIEKTKEFLTSLKQQAGKITKREFVKYEQSYAVYKTNFEKALLALTVSVDDKSAINGFFIKPFIEDNLPKPERNTTKLMLPFKDEWHVVWGGDTKEINYHVESKAQKNAFDMVIKNEKGNSYKTDGKTNEDYYAFNKELIAPCDGTVVLVVDGIKDNEPGASNPLYVPGNTVIIKTANNEYLFFGHFKQNSIVVKQGQKVNQGQLLGLCGNSGNSSEPHLHFHIQNVEDMNVATGIKCYFDKILVNGEAKTNYSPIQHQKVKNQ